MLVPNREARADVVAFLLQRRLNQVVSLLELAATMRPNCRLGLTEAHLLAVKVVQRKDCRKWVRVMVLVACAHAWTLIEV